MNLHSNIEKKLNIKNSECVFLISENEGNLVLLKENIKNKESHVAGL